MKFIGITCAVFCMAMGMLAQTTFTPISNFNQFNQSPQANGVYSGGSLAASFTTGVAATSLSSVSIYMLGLGGPGTFNLSLYSDASGLPGSNLASLSGNNNPASTGIYTYTNASSLVLSTNTTYWIVASSPNTLNKAYFWLAALNSALDSGSFWTSGSGAVNTGGGWTSNPGSYQLFSVSVANPQPPAISISQPIVLTFPATGFPFVLQQNSNLSTTNWVAVTNAILDGVISNQTVFLVPPSSGQMFYRLGSSQ
jgi:hypothetical protein